MRERREREETGRIGKLPPPSQIPGFAEYRYVIIYCSFSFMIAFYFVEADTDTRKIKK